MRRSNLPWPEEMLLPDELVQCPRPHSRRQRRHAVEVLLPRFGEEIHGLM
jgi:hypothetical protein